MIRRLTSIKRSVTRIAFRSKTKKRAPADIVYRDCECWNFSGIYTWMKQGGRFDLDFVVSRPAAARQVGN